MLIMERSFLFEAKTFCLSAKVGFPNLRLEERRKGFVGCIFTSIQCLLWLVDMVEEAIQSPVKEDFTKSYREGDKATMVHGGGNKAGRFLEVSVLAEGGRKGVISLPEGRYGKGWRQFAGELQQLGRLSSSYLDWRSVGLHLRLGFLWFFFGCDCPEIVCGSHSINHGCRGESCCFQGLLLKVSQSLFSVLLF